MSKSDRAKKRQQKRARFAKPSLPRVIGANDNIATANDNLPEVPDLSREPGVKETPGQRIFRQMLRRALDERPGPVRGYDPARLTAEQEKQLRRAEDKLRSGDPRRMESGRKDVEEIAKKVLERIEGHERKIALEEIKTLEALRGSEVSEAGRNEPPGRLTVRTRDGLKNLTRAWKDRVTEEMMPPALDPEGTLYKAALRYRADYEAIDPERELSPPILDPAKARTAHGGENWDMKRREIEDRVFTVKLMICGIDAPKPGERRALPRLPAGHPAMRAVYALDEIAGKGRALSDMTTSGSAKARIREDLIFALEACEIVYGLA